MLVRRTSPETGVDVYATTRQATDRPWVPPVVLDVLTSVDADGDAMLSSDGLEIYFYSTRSAGGDLDVARRANKNVPFGVPEPIEELNSAALDQDPWISPDGRHLFFASDRDGTLAIYESTR